MQSQNSLKPKQAFLVRKFNVNRFILHQQKVNRKSMKKSSTSAEATTMTTAKIHDGRRLTQHRQKPSQQFELERVIRHLSPENRPNDRVTAVWSHKRGAIREIANAAE